MLFDRSVYLLDRELLEFTLQILAEGRDLVVATVQRVAERGALCLQKDIDEFHQELPRRFERFGRETVAHELVEFIQRRAERENRLLGGHGPQPDLKDLFLPREVWVGLKLVHPAREIFDVSVVAVVETARL